MKKYYRIPVHVRGTDDRSRDSGWWGTIKADSAKDAMKKARKIVPRRYVVDQAELVRA